MLSSTPKPQTTRAGKHLRCRSTSLLHVNKIKIELAAIIGRLRALPHRLRFGPGRAFIDSQWWRVRVFASNGMLQAIVTLRFPFITLDLLIRAIQIDIFIPYFLQRKGE
jgi:hypothetical protein